MWFFSKREAKLKEIEKDLDKRQSELDNCESQLESAKSSLEFDKNLLKDAKAQFEAEREAFREEVIKAHENIASEKAEVEKGRIEISSIKKRELAITEREKKADKVLEIAGETVRKHKANKVEAEHLRNRAEAIAKERQSLEAEKAELAMRKQAVIASEQKRDAGFADERTDLNNELRDKRAKMESGLVADREQKLSALENEITELRAKRLEDITTAEKAERDRICLEIANEQKAWTKKQKDTRNRLEAERAAFEEDIAKLKTKRLEDITKAEQAERDRIRSEIANEQAGWAKLQENTRKQLEAERTELEKQKSAVSAIRSELEGRKAELEANERTLERKEQRMEQQWQKKYHDLDDKFEAQIEEERQSFETEKQSIKNENTRLRESLRIQSELVGAFDQLKRQLKGEDPTNLIRDLNSKTDELKRLHEKLANSPTEEMREKSQELEFLSERQQARIDELQKQVNANAEMVAETTDLRRKNSELDAENKSLSQKASIFEGAANEAQVELNRLRAAYERPAEVADRYKEIEMPHIKADKAEQPTKGDIDEITWLTGVGNACTHYGLHFNSRILKAFHTALKTAEWSPITILAGVSGTGKSELPRLYSHFGGLIFEPLSVQPNWDSQESMLGFFNSIDNRFDAQPVLQLLAQSQKKWIKQTSENEGYPGLMDAVCLILLDEMNLAHPELYFAEFLSKLELRRGMKGSDVPFLPVSIGAGMPRYQLPLGRNVLWAGTMNQDETTKSLSDKVLDRSIIIHFPRPTKLKRRLKLAPLDEKNRGPLLHKALWQSWLAQSTSFSEDDVKPFKKFIEDMNAALAVAGRAIGHRVWQSVEYYMANYPDVRAAQKINDKDELAKALHKAFEDQLVMKVMPKLRGIDTRGKSMDECLSKILGQINAGIGGQPFSLAEDFNLACDLGYGQFIWQSANYLKDDPDIGNVEDVTDEQEQGVESNREASIK